ncbi:MAG: WYL domain-containing protein [Oscillospiraceae bacterium]|nr:WYL domain-containing protein [Oscillospiraceae bacterium]
MAEELIKKTLILDILDILKHHSDVDHTLSQKDIEQILESEYGVTADRKAIKRNLDALQNKYSRLIKCGKIIKRSRLNKETGECEDNDLMSDFYYDSIFTDGELQLLIESVIASEFIPYNHGKELITKLSGLRSKYFSSKVRSITRLSLNKTKNQQLFLSIELLDEAIRKNKKISFKYIEYGTDKKEHPKKRKDGTIREYVVSPYKMAIKGGQFYLICNYEKYDDIANYRVDRLRDISILSEKTRPFETLNGSNGRKIDLEQYMSEHLYMFTSDLVRVQLRIPKDMISDIIDMFGFDVSFWNETSETVEVSVSANEKSIIQFAKCYAPDVMVLSPLRISKQIREELESTVRRYTEELK